jgi:hypothetical protein
MGGWPTMLLEQRPGWPLPVASQRMMMSVPREEPAQ